MYQIVTSSMNEPKLMIATMIPSESVQAIVTFRMNEPNIAIVTRIISENKIQNTLHLKSQYT